MMYDKIAGCLFGMALGDALGAETEFLNIKGILERFPPNGPQEPEGNPAKVTDDTQMALAVGEALLKAPRPYQAVTLMPILRQAYIDWYNDPENNRAPGVTCLDSVENLIRGDVWTEATNISSKGCGANMRVQAVGLLPDDEPTRAALAQFQAALTHGHPTGLAAADLTAWVIHDLLHDGDVHTLLERVRNYAKSQHKVYHSDWLGELYHRAYMFTTPKAYIAHGWDECLNKLVRLEEAVKVMDKYSDPCLATGGGWIAEEAFISALFCFLMYPDDPVAVIRRAAVTSGDSDSIACIAGAFAGAYNGLSSWSGEWIARIEYHQRLETLAKGIHAMYQPTTINS
jgi:ADP-ribosylglycohydrolase